jgi:hypothetical protein
VYWHNCIQARSVTSCIASPKVSGGSFVITHHHAVLYKPWSPNFLSRTLKSVKINITHPNIYLCISLFPHPMEHHALHTGDHCHGAFHINKRKYCHCLNIVTLQNRLLVRECLNIPMPPYRAMKAYRRRGAKVIHFDKVSC